MAKRTKTVVGITIQSHPEVQAKKKTTELPLHILFLGDLTPHVRAISGRSDQSSPFWDVTKETFAHLMQDLAPRLSIEVPDLIGQKAKTVEFELQFHDLKAFRPEGIASQIPALSRLLSVRGLVEKVSKGELSSDEFRTKAEAAGLDPDLARRFQEALSSPRVTASQPPPQVTPSLGGSPSQEEGKLGSLLRMVDLGAGEPPTKKPETMDALLTAITGDESGSGAPGSVAGGPAGVDRSVAAMLIADLDHMLGDQISAILHHPRFQALESCWRGLRFLVDRIDFRKNIRLSVLPIRQENLNDALVRQFVNPAGETLQQLAEAPVSVVIADFEFGISAHDVDQLHDIAETMSGAQVPFVASVGPLFFGLTDPSQLANLPVLWQHFQRPEYVTWNSLRDQSISAYVALALPRFLLRFPYGPDNPVKGFQFVESQGNPTQKGETMESKRILWGNPAVAIATTIARSFVESGWPTHTAGGRIEDLPLWQPFSHGSKQRIPLEINIAEDRQVELSEMGFTVLACRANDDAAYVSFAPTIYRPEKYEDADSNEEAQIHATLACRLMTTRILQYLLRFERELAPGHSPSRVKAYLVESLTSLLKTGGGQLLKEGVEVEMGDRIQSTNRIPLKIHLMTPPGILGRAVKIVMGYELALK